MIKLILTIVLSALAFVSMGANNCTDVVLHEWDAEAELMPRLVKDETGREEYDGTEKPEHLVTWVYDGTSFTPVAKVTADERYTIVHDYLGTPTQAYDTDGNGVWSRVLDMDGNVLEETGNVGMIPFLFQGQYYDRETGLAYNRFRYYAPKTGAYISQDPIGLAGGILNLYGYVSDTNAWIDIWGLAKHHTTPRQIYNPRKYKKADGTIVRSTPILTDTLATDKRIRGTKKEPNMWDIPDDVHRAIHNPNSEISKRNGGDYNSVFIQRVNRLPNPTAEAVLAIRDQMTKDYDIEKYRPHKTYQK